MQARKQNSVLRSAASEARLIVFTKRDSARRALEPLSALRHATTVAHLRAASRCRSQSKRCCRRALALRSAALLPSASAPLSAPLLAPTRKKWDFAPVSEQFRDRAAPRPRLQLARHSQGPRSPRLPPRALRSLARRCRRAGYLGQPPPEPRKLGPKRRMRHSQRAPLRNLKQKM